MTLKEFNRKAEDQIQKMNAVVRKGFEAGWFYIALICVTIFAVVARTYFFDCITGDINSFLIPWYRTFYEHGSVYALGQEIGDYTPAYMYILGIISWFKLDPDSLAYVHALKVVSCLFDFASAVFVLLISALRLKQPKWVSLLGYTFALFLPTILLNSAYWGQCDSIFSFFVVISIFFLLGNHQRTGLILYGVSLAFKLQGIFFLPVLVYLVLIKKLKLRFFIYIPLVYILFALPSTFCGRSFSNIMGIYFSQTESYPYLTLNAPTLYAFISNSFDGNDYATKYLLPSVTWMALSLFGVFICVFYQKKKEPDDVDILEMTYFFALFAPFLLPRMHERYFYLADILGIAFFIAKPEKFYIVLLSAFGSLTGYLNYLFGFNLMNNDSNLNLRIGALCILLAICFLVYDLLFKKDSKKTLTNKL